MGDFLQDVRTVLKKELKEIVLLSLGYGQLFSLFMFIFLFGFFIPFEQGEFFLRQTSTSLALYIFMVPLVISSGLVADSFAGERDRKTLEALLATRLTDGALFAGKVLAVFIYTYVYALVVILTSVGGANYYIHKAGKSGAFFYNPLSCFALFGFIIPVIMAGIAVGVFFSLKCKDLRTAFQFSRIGWFIICLPIIVGWVKFTMSWDFLIPAFYILFLTDAILLFIAVKFFRRSALLS